MFSFLKKDILISKTNIGLVKSKNEDSCITIKHPNNKKIKLLAVADGLSGYAQGELASHFAISCLEKWFKGTKTNILNSVLLCTESLYKTIININNSLYNKEYNRSKCATTLTCAIITERITIIANIGDSRAYAIKGKNIKQLTKDDSLIWAYYEYGKLTKDDLRFHSQNNLVTKCIGHEYNTKPTILLVNNNSYTGLLLMTDGITDCLSDEKIQFIVDKNHGKNIASKLLYEAIYRKQNDIVPNGIAFHNIRNGQDNATVALYIKYI